MEMIRIWRGFAVIGLVALLGVPVTFFATFALMPLWSAIERRHGIESVGHSGPAEWCFWTVFAVYLAAASIVARLLRDKP
jgi:4-amino-4-deoxy-L-arabinose transferase-like glycosyltransferase